MPRQLDQYTDQGVEKTFFEGENGGFVKVQKADLTSTLESNKRSYAQTDERARWGDWSKVASIPLVVFHELNKQGICRGFHVIDQKRMKAWLNDPENRYFRTRPGKI